MEKTYVEQLAERVSQKCRQKGSIFGSIEGKAILEVVAEELQAIKEAQKKLETKESAAPEKSAKSKGGK